MIVQPTSIIDMELNGTGRINGTVRKGGFPARTTPSWHIALLANVKGDEKWNGDIAAGATALATYPLPEDAGAEFDSHETIQSITAALAAEGHRVTLCPADATLPHTLTTLQPDICFNIAEGIGGDAREAQAPALCELLGLPYTGSRVLANALSLDKTQTKRIWQSLGLPTAGFQEFSTGREPLDPSLGFPLFVKPAREGTGMGMGPASIVTDEAALRERVAWVLATYRQPALVEAFLPGREFTVGFIGNPGKLPPRFRSDLYDQDGYHFFPVLEIGTDQSISPGVYGYQAKAKALDEIGAPAYLCPADVSGRFATTLYQLTRQAAEAIGVCDVARVDFRLDRDGVPRLLEINTLPGLNPSVSDLCIMARAEGMAYETLISEILHLGAARFHLPAAVQVLPVSLGQRAPLPLAT